MENPIIIGIAGGSGSGKSTTAIELYNRYPGFCEIIHLDDYFVKRSDAPKKSGYINWEVPEVINYTDLINDINKLKAGEKVIVRTKSELFNPEFDHKLSNYKKRTIYSKKIIFIEGYLVLANKFLISLLDYKIYLDIQISDSLERRSTNKFKPDPEYIKKVLIPMHKKYVLPTKKIADFVVKASDNSLSQVCDIIDNKILKNILTS